MRRITSKFYSTTTLVQDYVQYLVGVEGDIDKIEMKRLDKLGFDVRVTKGDDSGVLRIPFTGSRASLYLLPSFPSPLSPLPPTSRPRFRAHANACMCVAQNLLASRVCKWSSAPSSCTSSPHAHTRSSHV